MSHIAASAYSRASLQGISWGWILLERLQWHACRKNASVIVIREVDIAHLFIVHGSSIRGAAAHAVSLCVLTYHLVLAPQASGSFLPKSPGGMWEGLDI